MLATETESPQELSVSGRQRPVRVLLVYPHTRSVALSNLGFQQVYSLLNRIDGVECDRYALPNDWSEGSPLKKSQLRSLDGGKPADEFDLIAFSISYEPDYLNAVVLLEAFGIPLERTGRTEGPLIAAGGSAIFINPEPLADICDVFFIGEAEGLIEPFFRQWTGSNTAVKESLPELGRLPGIYVPELYTPQYEQGRQVALTAQPSVPERVRRHAVEGPTNLCTHSEIHNEDTTFNNMALMEVTRGCIWACRFCTAGFIYRPPREPDLQNTYDSLAGVLKKQGAEASTIGLLGPSVTDHPDLLPLARRLVDEGKKLSFSSLRMETLTDELVDLMLKSGQKTLTVAVDAPSERMRNVINKSATDEFIVEKCRFLVRKGILHLKIYSIIGLPGEEDEDIQQFIQLVERIQSGYVEECRARGNIGKVTISVSALVPKPGTPFQWHPMEQVKTLKKRFMHLRKTLGRLENLKLSFGSPNEAYLQTFLSRGDRRLLGFFRTYLENRHDAKSALKASAPHPDEFVYRQYKENDCLPWDIIDHGYVRGFLWQDYQRALREVWTPVCDTATCKICGVC